MTEKTCNECGDVCRRSAIRCENCGYGHYGYGNGYGYGEGYGEGYGNGDGDEKDNGLEEVIND